jgi:hypothetical protein
VDQFLGFQKASHVVNGGPAGCHGQVERSPAAGMWHSPLRE